MVEMPLTGGYGRKTIDLEGYHRLFNAGIDGFPYAISDLLNGPSGCLPSFDLFALRCLPGTDGFLETGEDSL